MTQMHTQNGLPAQHAIKHIDTAPIADNSYAILRICKYIQASREKKKSWQQIHQDLLSVGWPLDMVEDAIDHTKNRLHEQLTRGPTTSAHAVYQPREENAQESSPAITKLHKIAEKSGVVTSKKAKGSKIESEHNSYATHKRSAEPTQKAAQHASEPAVSAVEEQILKRLEETKEILSKLEDRKNDFLSRSLREKLDNKGHFFSKEINSDKARSTASSFMTHLHDMNQQFSSLYPSMYNQPGYAGYAPRQNPMFNQAPIQQPIQQPVQQAQPIVQQPALQIVQPNNQQAEQIHQTVVDDDLKSVLKDLALAMKQKVVQNAQVADPFEQVNAPTQRVASNQTISAPVSIENSSPRTVTVQTQAPQSAPVEESYEDQHVQKVAKMSSSYQNPSARLQQADQKNINLKVELIEEKLNNMSVNQRLADAEPMQFGFYNPVVPDELELVSTPIGDRAQTGIPDLDSVIDGGFPRKSSVLISGGPGSGKTTMALQYLVNGVVLYNEPGVLISFEQTRESIIAVGRQFGWDIENLEKQHMLFIHEYTPEQLEKAISAGGGSLRDMVDSIKAKRFVLDSISEYLAMFPSELGKRKACTDFYRAVTKWGCTLIIIGEEDTDGTNRVSSVADYESDAVIRLYNERKGDIRLRSLEIFKMRDTRHAGRLFPMKMTSNGIIVRVKDPILASRQ